MSELIHLSTGRTRSVKLIHGPSTPGNKVDIVVLDAKPPATGNIHWHIPAEGFCFTYVEHASEALDEHCHSRPALNLVLSGSYAESCSAYRGCFEPGCLLFKPARAVHTNGSTRPRSRSLIVEITSELADELHVTLDHAWQRFDPRMMGLAQRLFGELATADADASLAVSSLVRELFAIGRADDSSHLRRPRWLDTVERRLADLGRPTPDLSDLASLAGVCPTHLARAFRRHAGATPGEYLRARRIAFVLDQLSASKKPLVEIAAAGGFADQSHMIRTFRRIVGQTPAGIRAHLNQR